MKLTPEHCAVLNVFKEREIEEGEYLSSQTLNRECSKLSKKIQASYDLILRDLIKAGYLSFDPLGYGLTEKGHYILSSSLD